jgi:hypothetical protein
MMHVARVPCAASILLLAACQGTEGGKATPPEMRLTGVQFRAYRDASLSMRGQAEEVVYLRQTAEVRARDAVVSLPQPGASELRISAPVVEGDVSARTYRASGGVVATRGSDEARTPSARWSAADGLVHGDEPVELRGPSYRLTGPSFTLDPATGDLDIRGGVRVVASAPAGAGR